MHLLKEVCIFPSCNRRSWAAIDKNILNSFFDNLEKVFEEIGMSFLQSRRGVEINYAVVKTSILNNIRSM